MEEEVSSDGSTSASEDPPIEDIASPDPVEDTAVPASSETFLRDDDRSQTPLQDEVGGGADEQVAATTGSAQETDTSETPQQDVTNADLSKSCDDKALKPTIRDEHEELDYDEEVQPDGNPVATTNDGSPSNKQQKAADEEEKEEGEEREEGEEKVDN